MKQPARNPINAIYYVDRIRYDVIISKLNEFFAYYSFLETGRQNKHWFIIIIYVFQSSPYNGTYRRRSTRFSSWSNMSVFRKTCSHLSTHRLPFVHILWIKFIILSFVRIYIGKPIRDSLVVETLFRYDKFCCTIVEIVCFVNRMMTSNYHNIVKKKKQFILQIRPLIEFYTLFKKKITRIYRCLHLYK